MIGSSSKNGGSTVMNMTPKAMEAELIQKATQTAIIAARSILMSGGTEESALKTAKAAAESVLNPAGSENGTVSGSSTLGNAFGGKRRKAKRQAEVVASMALMSATSLQPNGSNIVDCDSVNKMYGRNIITVRQDEPSVLSGSTRPPAAPTPNSIAGSAAGRFSFTQKKEVRDQPEQTSSANSTRPPLPPTSPTAALSSAFNSLLTGGDDDTESNLLGVNPLSQSCSMDSMSSDESVSEDESDEETASYFYEKRKSGHRLKSKSKKNSSWSFADALMNPFVGTLNIMQCGQGALLPLDQSRLEYRGKKSSRKTRRKRSSKRRARENSILDSRDDDAFDDETAFSVENKKRGTYRDPDFPDSYSCDSSHSEITDFSEQEINVRSSIRDTMESIVNKTTRLDSFGGQSKKSDKKKSRGKSKPSSQNNWKSYESPKRESRSPKHSLKTKQSSTTVPKRGRSLFRKGKK